MEVRLLGELEVVGDDGPLPIPAGKPRALLVLLALHANEPVDTDRIVDALWDGEHPRSAAGTVQTYVSRLRKLLGSHRIETVGHGYRLVLARGERDLDHVEELRTRSRSEAPEDASATLRAALTLFRGRPLGDVSAADFAQPEILRLTELRWDLLGERMDADLAAGRHAQVLGELQELVIRRPLDERLRGQLMLALYRSGRQADALSTYGDAYRALNDELGLEPSAELKALQRRILAQDRSLDPPRVGQPTAPRVASALPRGWRRHRKIMAGLGAYTVVLITVGVAAGIALDRQAPRVTPSIAIVANSVTVVDPRELTVVAGVTLGAAPRFVTSTSGAVWAATGGDSKLLRIDTGTRRVTLSVDLGFTATDLEGAGDSVWVSGGYDAILARYGSDGTVRVTVDLRRRFGEPSPGVPRARAGLASSREGLWLAYGDEVALLDPTTGVTLGRAQLSGGRFHDMDVGGTGFVESIEHARVVSFNPRTLAEERSLEVGNDVSALLVNSGFVWVTRRRVRQVWQLDESDSRLRRTIDIDASPVALAAFDDAVWVVTQSDPSLRRIDVRDGRMDAALDLEHTPEDVTVANDLLWIAVRSP